MDEGGGWRGSRHPVGRIRFFVLFIYTRMYRAVDLISTTVLLVMIR